MEKKVTAPPYLSWKTFTGFVKSFDQGLPPRIDRSAMSRLSGVNQNQMTNALNYLKLVGVGGKPEPLLEQIVETSTPERQTEYQGHLRTMLKNAYPFLFDGTGDFNPERSTPSQLDERFRAVGISGDTVQKCEAFFIAASQEAGIKLSRLILDSKKRGRKSGIPGASPKPRVKAGTKGGDEDAARQSAGDEYGGVQDLPGWYSTFKAAFDKLPEFGKAHWTSAERDKWIVLVTALVDVYVEVDDEKKQ